MATTNSLKFYRKSTAPSSPVAGAIWFNTSDKTIQIYTGTEWEKYAGNLKDATWSSDKKTLTITKHDGSSIALDFSDMASATFIAGEIARLDKAITDGDAAAKGYADTQIGNATNTLIGTAGDAATASTIFGAKAHATAKADEAFNGAKEWTSDAIDALNATPSDSDDNGFVTVSLTQEAGIVTNVTVATSNIASASELATVKGIAEAAQTADEVSTAITTAINALDATVSDEHDPNVKISVTETDGKLTGVSVTTADIASASTLAEVKGKVDAFFAGADISETAEQYKDTLKELQTYLTEDAAAAATMAGNIAANKTDVRTFATSTVNGHAIGTVVEDKIVAQTIVLNGSEIKLDGYVKNSATDASIATTDTINAALGKLEAKADKALTDASNAAAAGVTSLNDKTGAVTIATGTSNGSIKVGDADVAVKGLGSAAYTASTEYATAAQGAKADSALQEITTGNSAAIVITGTSVVTPLIATNSDLKSGIYDGKKSGTTPLVDAAGLVDYTQAYVSSKIDAALVWEEF